MREIKCGFRGGVQCDDRGETAHCELLRRLLNDPTGQRSRIHRSACEYCGGETASQPARMMEVMTAAIRADPTIDRDDPVMRLSDRFVPRLASNPPAPNGRGHSPATAVDVVMAITRMDVNVFRVIHAWLHQRGVHVVLHLVGDETVLNQSRGQPMLVDHPNVRFHRHLFAQCDAIRMVFEAAHRVTRSLESNDLALAAQDALPVTDHLAIATQQLARSKATWFAAATSKATSSLPELGRWQRCVQPETIVIRRSTWVDLAGPCDPAYDVDVDFFQRAVAEEHYGTIHPTQTVRVNDESTTTLGPAPPWFHGELLSKRFTWYQHGRGFGLPRLACDVILPFRGQLEWVEEAVESVRTQEGIDWTLHLIDDATPEPTDQWLKQFCDDPRVRVYRNRINIGQFASFNNVAKHCSSDWLVTQDGDDVSLPGRLKETVTIAALCDADLLGAATTLIGSDEAALSMQHLAVQHGSRTTYHRRSFPAGSTQAWYYLENPTLVHKRSYFLRGRGFADFGNITRNRTTLDTEWMMRAMLDGANIVACQRLAVGYRLHNESAIHHPKTRMGSPVRQWSHRELSRRLRQFAEGGIAPATMGSMDRHADVTEVWAA